MIIRYFFSHSRIDLFTLVYEFIHLDNTNPSKQGDLEGRVGGRYAAKFSVKLVHWLYYPSCCPNFSVLVKLLFTVRFFLEDFLNQFVLFRIVILLQLFFYRFSNDVRFMFEQKFILKFSILSAHFTFVF